MPHTPSHITPLDCRGLSPLLDLKPRRFNVKTHPTVSRCLAMPLRRAEEQGDLCQQLQLPPELWGQHLPAQREGPYLLVAGVCTGVISENLSCLALGLWFLGCPPPSLPGFVSQADLSSRQPVQMMRKEPSRFFFFFSSVGYRWVLGECLCPAVALAPMGPPGPTL